MIEPENFIRIGTATNCHPIYKIHLQHIDELYPEKALSITIKAGGKSGEWDFAEFETVDLPALCKQINHIIDGE